MHFLIYIYIDINKQDNHYYYNSTISFEVNKLVKYSESESQIYKNGPVNAYIYCMRGRKNSFLFFYQSTMRK